MTTQKMMFRATDWAQIDEVKVVKETDKCVFVERLDWRNEPVVEKYLKESDSYFYGRTWEEARGWILKKRQADIDKAQEHLSYTIKQFNDVERMKP